MSGFISRWFPGLARHFSVLSASWALERQRARDHRQLDETEFLPAALEVIETPASPAARMLLLALCALVVVALLWSVLGRLDTVAVASGKILPAGRVKVIQPMEIGVVRAIHVKEGDRVSAGQLLVELDPTLAGADAVQAERALLSAQTETARARGVLAYLNGGEAAFEAPGGLLPEMRATVTALVHSTAAEYEARRETILKTRGQREAELAVAKAEIAKLADTLPLLETQLHTRQELAEQGYDSKIQVLELEERYIERQRNVEVQEANAARARAAIAGLDAQLNELREDLRKSTLTELSEAEQEAGLRAEEMKKTVLRRELQELRSPVAGAVQQLAVHTVGGVVQPAEALMVVVPRDAELVVDAQVLNKDIGFVHAGQRVAVKLDAFPFTDYGLIEGTVERISRDAVADEHKGLVFLARLRLDRPDIEIGNRRVALAPGMAVQAEIKTGERRIIQYLLSPIRKTLGEAARER